MHHSDDGMNVRMLALLVGAGWPEAQATVIAGVLGRGGSVREAADAARLVEPPPFEPLELLPRRRSKAQRTLERRRARA